MQLGFEAVCLDFTAPTINSPRLSSLFAFFLYKLRNKGILTYWLGFLPYWNDEKTLKFILGMLVRKKTSGYVCLMASLTSFKTSSEAVSSMTTKHPIGRFKRCSTTRITSRPNGQLETSGVIYLRTKRRASKTLQRLRQSKFSILRSVSNWSRFNSVKLKRWCNLLERGTRQSIMLKPWKESILQDIFF